MPAFTWVREDSIRRTPPACARPRAGRSIAAGTLLVMAGSLAGWRMAEGEPPLAQGHVGLCGVCWRPARPQGEAAPHRATGDKTQAALRDAPIHPDAPPIFPRRSQGRDAGQFVFDELATPPDGWERGSAITKAFGRLRTRLGRGAPGGATAGLQGPSQPPWMARWQVSGRGLGLSMTSHYAGKESLEAKAKAVEAVRLPSL